jgi:hypothetical protein
MNSLQRNSYRVELVQLDPMTTAVLMTSSKTINTIVFHAWPLHFRGMSSCSGRWFHRSRKHPDSPDVPDKHLDMEIDNLRASIPS